MAEVDQNPTAVAIALRPGHGETVLADLLGDGVRDRARLDLGAPAYDNERVGDDSPPIEIEDGDVFGFFVFGGFADDVYEIRQGRFSC